MNEALHLGTLAADIECLLYNLLIMPYLLNFPEKPSVKGPIDLSLDDSGNVLCSLTLENFSPRNVQIKWNCGVGINQELPSTEDIKKNQDHTFQCNSTCRIPKHFFIDPGSKVQVTWTHGSLDQPGSQELSLKGITIYCLLFKVQLCQNYRHKA